MVKLRVFTRSAESKKVLQKDKPLMKIWFSDTSLPRQFQYFETKLQSNYFRLCD